MRGGDRRPSVGRRSGNGVAAGVFRSPAMVEAVYG